jgi:N-acetylglutamate synthase-like GNAT family acetyltransferase
MEEGVRVRPARSADLAAVTALLDGAGLSTAGLPPSLANFLVAVNGGRIVGTVGLEPYGAAGGAG